MSQFKPVRSIDIEMYIKQLQKMKRIIKKKQQEQNAKFDEVWLYASCDDEGNNFSPVHFLPGIKYINSRTLTAGFNADGMDVYDTLGECAQANIPYKNIIPVVVIN